jgi:hypothetical protein
VTTPQSPPKPYLLDTIISAKNCIIAYVVHGLVPLLGHPLVPCPLSQGPPGTFNGPPIDLPETFLQWVVPLSLLVPGMSHHGPSHFPLGPHMVFPLVNGSSLLNGMSLLIKYMSHSVWGSSSTFLPLLFLKRLIPGELFLDYGSSIV